MSVIQQDAFHSPETDVSVLSDRRYPHLCKNTSFVTSTGQNHREIKHETMFHALCLEKAAALPAFHVSNGAGNTECFSESLLKSNPKKAPGHDGLSPKILKLSTAALATPLTNLFNYCIRTSTLPGDWKMSNVTPIHKKDQVTDKNNY